MKNFTKNILFITILVPVLCGCTGTDGKFDPRKPYSLDMTPPKGPPEYEQGWIDGCESGSATYSNNFYMFTRVFKFRQDPILRNNKMYYQVWKDAFLYCSLYWERINGGFL